MLLRARKLVDMRGNAVDLAEGIRKLRAGDWDGAHEIAQSETSPLGAWLHGIIHLMEGDLGNARYWYSRAGRACPTVDAIESELDALEVESERRGS